MTDVTARRWPLWKKITAYVALLALAVASVWFVDRKVRHLPDRESGGDILNGAAGRP